MYVWYVPEFRTNSDSGVGPYLSDMLLRKNDWEKFQLDLAAVNAEQDTVASSEEEEVRRVHEYRLLTLLVY